MILAWLVAEDDGAKKKIQDLLTDRDENLGTIKMTLQGSYCTVPVHTISVSRWLLTEIAEQINTMTATDDPGLKDMLSTLLDFL